MCSRVHVGHRRRKVCITFGDNALGIAWRQSYVYLWLLYVQELEWYKRWLIVCTEWRRCGIGLLKRAVGRKNSDRVRVWRVLGKRLPKFRKIVSPPSLTVIVPGKKAGNWLFAVAGFGTSNWDILQEHGGVSTVCVEAQLDGRLLCDWGSHHFETWSLLLAVLSTVIPRLTKIIRSGITFLSRKVVSRRFL